MSAEYDELIKFLKLLSDDTRLKILEALKEDSKTSKQLENLLDKTQSTISHQLNQLIESNLIESEIKREDEEDRKQINYYKIKNHQVFTLLSKIQDFIERVNTEDFLKRRKRDLHDILD